MKHLFRSYLFVFKTYVIIPFIFFFSVTEFYCNYHHFTTAPFLSLVLFISLHCYFDCNTQIGARMLHTQTERYSLQHKFLFNEMQLISTSSSCNLYLPAVHKTFITPNKHHKQITFFSIFRILSLGAVIIQTAYPGYGTIYATNNTSIVLLTNNNKKELSPEVHRWTLNTSNINRHFHNSTTHRNCANHSKNTVKLQCNQVVSRMELITFNRDSNNSKYPKKNKRPNQVHHHHTLDNKNTLKQNRFPINNSIYHCIF